MAKINVPTSNMVSDEVMADLNVLRPLVLDRVVGDLDSTFIVA
jgi:hypothetical protein